MRCCHQAKFAQRGVLLTSPPGRQTCTRITERAACRATQRHAQSAPHLHLLSLLRLPQAAAWWA